jgi:ATP-dependent DNA helicase RecG
MAQLDPSTLEENQTVEHKESFNERALKSLCAFANTDGGSVFIPVDDNGVVLDNPLSDEERQIIANGVINNLGLQPDINSHEWDGKDFIEIQIPKSDHPVHLKGRYYIRVDNTTQRMNPEQLQNRMLHRVPWDTQIADNITLDDLDETEIKRFVKSGQDAGRISSEIDPNEPEAVLRQTSLLQDEGLTNAALLLFGENPQSRFPSAVVRIGVFATESDITDDKIAKGHLFQQVRRAEDILKSHMQHGYEISDEEFTRKEQWAYPLPAFREGIMNALIHRDYHRQGSQIQVKLFPDRLSIFSPGGLPDELSIEDLLTDHPSIRRNNLLAEVFFRAGLIESFGSGISRIRNSLKDANLPQPILEDKGHSFVLTFTQKKKQSVKDDVDTTELSERQLKIIELAEQAPIRTKDLEEHFPDVTVRTIRNDIKKLVEKEILHPKGKTKSRRYVLRLNNSE